MKSKIGIILSNCMKGEDQGNFKKKPPTKRRPVLRPGQIPQGDHAEHRYVCFCQNEEYQSFYDIMIHCAAYHCIHLSGSDPEFKQYRSDRDKFYRLYEIVHPDKRSTPYQVANKLINLEEMIKLFLLFKSRQFNQRSSGILYQFHQFLKQKQAQETPFFLISATTVVKTANQFYLQMREKNSPLTRENLNAIRMFCDLQYRLRNTPFLLTWNEHFHEGDELPNQPVFSISKDEQMNRHEQQKNEGMKEEEVMLSGRQMERNATKKEEQGQEQRAEKKKEEKEEKSPKVEEQESE